MRPARTIVVTERRSVTRRLPRADVDDLLRSFRPVVEVVPTFTRGTYRLTPRGYVGVFQTTNFIWQVRPKVGWAGLQFLLGDDLSPHQGTAPSGPADWPAELATLLAARLATLMRERATGGLIRGYVERETESATVRGRIDLARQVRDATRVGHRFHLVEDEFTADVPWNQVPVTVARHLVDSHRVAPDARAALMRAVELYAGVTSVRTPTPEMYGQLVYDARTGAYRPLIELCQLIDTVPRATGEGTEQAGLLLNLERLFQQHVTDVLRQSARVPAGWDVRACAPVALRAVAGGSDLELIPDLLIVDETAAARAVWDVKWKTLADTGPDPADVHQALGYAAATGARVAGLIYPGRRFTALGYQAAGATFYVVTHRVSGDAARLAQGADRLARLVFARAHGTAGL